MPTCILAPKDWVIHRIEVIRAGIGAKVDIRNMSNEVSASELKNETIVGEY